MFGHFSPESLLQFAEAYGLDPGMQDFSEGVFDFKVCQKADGKHYGISDNEKCGKGAREVTKAPSKGFLGMNPGKAINFETAKLQGDAATKNYPRKKVQFLRNLPGNTPEEKSYNKKVYDNLKGFEQYYLADNPKTKGNGPLAAKLASLAIDASMLWSSDLITSNTYQDYIAITKKSPDKIASATDLLYQAAVKGKGQKAAAALAKMAKAPTASAKPTAPRPKPKPSVSSADAEYERAKKEAREEKERIKRMQDEYYGADKAIEADMRRRGLL